MFYLIGLGLNSKQLTLEAIDSIKACSRVFFESYTSKFAGGGVSELEKLSGKRFIELKREGVESGFGLILKDSREEDIALLVFGNPLNATTHIQLLLDAKRLGIKAKVIAGLSIFDFLGNTGLDAYKFGRVCSIVFPRENYSPESFYEMIEKNHSIGLHTLCLLDIDAERDNLMSVSEALAILEKIEKKKGKSILADSVLVGLYGIGSLQEKIKAGHLPGMKRSSYAAFPQSLIVCGQLNEKEKEALKAIADLEG